MTKALVSFGVGPAFEQMFEIALPSFEAFAERHDYDLLIPHVGDEQLEQRPASWWKVPALVDALRSGYDEVLWIDADAVVVDDGDDLDVPPEFWQALVAHRTNEGEVPGAGFWLVRPPMLPVLDRVWSMTNYLRHRWWEQGALCDLLGYRGLPQFRVADSDPPELIERTYYLDHGWSVCRADQTPTERQRVMQATGWPDRVAVMREWAASRTPTAPIPARS